MSDDASITLASLERVLLRLSLTPESELGNVLNILLPRLLAVSPASLIVEVRNKWLEVLSHIRTRVRDRVNVPLPFAALVLALRSSGAAASPLLIIFIDLALSRADPSALDDALPILLRLHDFGMTGPAREWAETALLEALPHARIPSLPEERKNKFGIFDTSSSSSLEIAETVARLCADVLLVPLVRNEGLAVTTTTTTASATGASNALPTPLPPPGLTTVAYNRALRTIGNTVISNSALIIRRSSIARLVFTEGFLPSKVTLIIALAGAESGGDVGTVCDETLKRLESKDMFRDDDETLNTIFSFLLGGDGRSPGPAILRTRAFALLNNSRGAAIGTRLPLAIRAIFEGLFGIGTTPRLVTAAARFAATLVFLADPIALRPFAPLLLGGLEKAIRAHAPPEGPAPTPPRDAETAAAILAGLSLRLATAPLPNSSHVSLAGALASRATSEAARAREAAWRALAALTRASPGAFVSRAAPARAAFSALTSEDPDVRTAISDTLSALANAYSVSHTISTGHLATPPAVLEELLTDILPAASKNVEARARVAAAEWVGSVFAFSDVRARFLAASLVGDERGDVRDAARAALRPYGKGRHAKASGEGKDRGDVSGIARRADPTRVGDIEMGDVVGDNTSDEVNEDDDDINNSLDFNTTLNRHNGGGGDDDDDEDTLRGPVFAKLARFYPLFANLVRFLTAESGNSIVSVTVADIVNDPIGMEGEENNDSDGRILSADLNAALNGIGSSNLSSSPVAKRARGTPTLPLPPALAGLSALSLAALLEFGNTTLDASAARVGKSTFSYIEWLDSDTTDEEEANDVTMAEGLDTSSSILAAWRGVLEASLRFPPDLPDAALLHATAASCLAAMTAAAPARTSKYLARRLPWLVRWLGDASAPVRASMACVIGAAAAAVPLGTSADALINALVTAACVGDARAGASRHGAILALGRVLAALVPRWRNAAAIITNSSISVDAAILPAAAAMSTLANALSDSKSHSSLKGAAVRALTAIARRGSLPINEGNAEMVSISSRNSIIAGTPAFDAAALAPVDVESSSITRVGITACLWRLAAGGSGGGVGIRTNDLTGSGGGGGGDDELSTSSRTNDDGTLPNLAATALGSIARGEILASSLPSVLPPIARFAITALLSLFRARSEGLLLTAGAALANACINSKAPLALTDVISALLSPSWGALLSSRGSERAAGAAWTLALLEPLAASSGTSNNVKLNHMRIPVCARADDIRSALTRCLGDASTLGSAAAADSLSALFEILPASGRASLTKSLAAEVTAGSTVGASGGDGSTLPAPGDAAYRELVALSTKAGAPELALRFVALARGGARAARGGGAAAALAAVLKSSARADAAPHLAALLPRLVLGAYDPAPRARESARALLAALVPDTRAAVRRSAPLILTALINASGAPAAREREAACAALAELLPGRTLAEVRTALRPMWRAVLRASDDVSDSVRAAGAKALTALTSLTLRLAGDGGAGASAAARTDADAALGVALPLLLSEGVCHPNAAAAAAASAALVSLARAARPARLLRHVPALVATALAAAAAFEPPSLAYIGAHAAAGGDTALGSFGEGAAELVDAARISATKNAPLADALDAALRALAESPIDSLTAIPGGVTSTVDSTTVMDVIDNEEDEVSGGGGSTNPKSSSLPPLPALITAVRSCITTGVGLPARGAAARFVTALTRAIPATVLIQFSSPLFASLIELASGSERNATLRKEFAAAAGALARTVPLSSLTAASRTLTSALLRADGDAIDRASALYATAALARGAIDARTALAGRAGGPAARLFCYAAGDDDAHVRAAARDTLDALCIPPSAAARSAPGAISAAISLALTSQEWSTQRRAAGAVVAWTKALGARGGGGGVVSDDASTVGGVSAAAAPPKLSDWGPLPALPPLASAALIVLSDISLAGGESGGAIRRVAIPLAAAFGKAASTGRSWEGKGDLLRAMSMLVSSIPAAFDAKEEDDERERMANGNETNIYLTTLTIPLNTLLNISSQGDSATNTNADIVDDAIDEAFNVLPVTPLPVCVSPFFSICAHEAARSASPRDNIIAALDAMSLIARVHINTISISTWDTASVVLESRITTAATRASTIIRDGNASILIAPVTVLERGTLRGGARTDSADAIKSQEVREEDDGVAIEAAALASALAVSLPINAGAIRAARVGETVRTALVIAGGRGSLPPRVRAARAAATLSVRINDLNTLASLITCLFESLERETRFPTVRAELLSALAVCASSAKSAKILTSSSMGVITTEEGENDIEGSSDLLIATRLALIAIQKAENAPGATVRVIDAARDATRELGSLQK